MKMTTLLWGAAVQSFHRKWGFFSVLIVLALLFSIFGVAYALSAVIDLGENQQNAVILGPSQNAYLGELTGSGDFNGDGVMDILLGAPGVNHNGSYSGAAYMLFGYSSFPSTVNLSSQAAKLTVYGANQNDVLGHSVASGDVNGDGRYDMIITADGYNNQRGAVYVVLGDSTRFNNPVTIDLASGGSVALTILGANAGDRLGRSVTSADINGDGYDDIIIGAYTASPLSRTEAGSVYVILGSSSLGGTIDLGAQQANLTLYGPEGGAKVVSLATPEADTGAPALLMDDINIANADLGSRLGRSVAVGDINNDNNADIIAGAYGANVSGKVDAGKAYVVFGSTGYTSGTHTSLDLGNNTANVTLNGIDTNDQAGFVVNSGDLDNNSYDDVLVGAYFADGPGNNYPDMGEAYAVFGWSGLSGVTINLATQANVTVYGADAGDRLSRSMVAGDINNDGYEDWVLGASRANPLGKIDAGIVYAISGGGSLPGQVWLRNSGTAMVQILGAKSTGSNTNCDEPGTPDRDCSDETGHSVALGNINGDAYMDIIAGALFANNNTIQDAGAVYLIYGRNFSTVEADRVYMPVLRR